MCFCALLRNFVNKKLRYFEEKCQEKPLIFHIFLEWCYRLVTEKILAFLIFDEPPEINIWLRLWTRDRKHRKRTYLLLVRSNDADIGVFHAHIVQRDHVLGDLENFMVVIPGRTVLVLFVHTTNPEKNHTSHFVSRILHERFFQFLDNIRFRTARVAYLKQNVMTIIYSFLLNECAPLS